MAQWLSQEQVATFGQQGFVVVENVLTKAEITRSLEECDRLQESVAEQTTSRGRFNMEAPEGGFHGQRTRQDAYKGVLRKVQDVVDESPWFADLSRDIRFKEMLGGLLGDNLLLTTSVLWYKPPEIGSPKPWHQDYAYFTDREAADITVWIALDEATQENGCVQCISGSHLRGLVPHHGAELQIDPASLDLTNRVYCELKPGSAVLFHCLTIHNTDSNTSKHSRRALTLRYAPA